MTFSVFKRSPLSDFLAERRASGCSPDTLYMYDYICSQPQEWTTEGLQGFFGQLHARLSPASVHTFYRHLGVYCRWLEAQGHERIQLPAIKEPKIQKRPIPLAVMRNVLKSMEGFGKFEDVRNYALILFLYDTGVRLGECLSVERQDLVLEEQMVYVEGKTGQRVVPYGRKTHKSLLRYLDARKDTCPWLWVGQKGPLTKHGVQTVFRRIRTRLGIRKFNPHLLRHSFAFAFLDSSDDIQAVKELLGHSNIRITEQYLHSNPSRLKRQHAKHSPGDRI